MKLKFADVGTTGLFGEISNIFVAVVTLEFRTVVDFLVVVGLNFVVKIVLDAVEEVVVKIVVEIVVEIVSEIVVEIVSEIVVKIAVSMCFVQLPIASKLISELERVNFKLFFCKIFLKLLTYHGAPPRVILASPIQMMFNAQR